YRTAMQDPTAGIALPADENVLVVSGGVATACYARTDCATTHAFGAAGLFDWSWAPLDPHAPPDTDPHPPIPDPWANGGYFAGREGPWLRQIGLLRDPIQMWRPARNPGGLLGRITRDDGTQTAISFLGEQVCSLPATGGTSATLVVGRNDLRDGQG